MKRAILILACLLALCPVAWGNTTGIEWGKGPAYNSQWWMWQSSTNKGLGLQWVDKVENLLGDDTSLGTGDIYYVDSGVANAGDGSSWSNAKATLAEAVALCTANNGDVIKVAAAGGESLTGAVTINIAGITIEGCGNGSDLPTYLCTDTDGGFTVTAASVTIKNLRFKPGISAVVSAITLAAGADYFTMENCEIVEPGTATYEFYDMVVWATGADFSTIIGNKFVSTVNTAGCNQALDLDTGIVNCPVIIGNEFQGNFAVAAIHSSRACTNCFIGWNYVYQQTSGQYAIEFAAAATGMAIGNQMWTDSYTTCFDPGSLAPSENKAINTIDLSETPIPARPAIGTVTAGSADDILKKLYYGADGTDAYPATVANDSTLAKIMAKGATATASTFDNTTDSLEAIGDGVAAILVDTAAADTAAEIADLGSTLVDNIVSATDSNGVIQGLALNAAPVANSLAAFVASGGVALGSQLATSKSLVDAIGSNGTALTDGAVSIAGILGIPTDADNLADSSTITSNRDGSILERLEFLCKYFETGTPGALVAPASTYSILDILGTDGSTTTGAVAGSILGAIGTNEAAASTPFTSAAVQADMDGSVLERLEAMAVRGMNGLTYNHPNYLAVRVPKTGEFDTTGVWSTAAKHEILTVTGAVQLTILCEIKTTLASVSDTGTMTLGDETTPASIIATTTIGSGLAATGEWWVDSTLADTIVTQTLMNALTFVVGNGKDIGYEVATNALSAGYVIFHVWWTPIDSTGAVVEATTGGVF